MPSVSQKGPQEEWASGRLAWFATTYATGPRKAEWSVSIRFVLDTTWRRQKANGTRNSGEK